MIQQPEKQAITQSVPMWLVGLAVMGGILGGAVIGGIAGYVAAGTVKPEMVVITPPPSAVSAESIHLTAVEPDAPADTVSAPLTENGMLMDAVEQVNPATVTVLNFQQAGMTSGSGVIIDAAGYLVTNNHVIEGAEKLEVIMAHGGRVTAQLVGQTSDFDLAVLKIDSADVSGVAKFGNSSVLRLGERVAAIGSALGGFRNTVTSGVISAHNRSLGGQSGLLQTDAPINHGNSGGPLINLRGEIIGINVMVYRGNNFSGDVAEGLGFAIPSNIAQKVVQQLIETGRAEMPFLGVSYSALNPQVSMEYGLSVTQGALIERILSGTAAAEAGLQANDIILAIDDQPVDDRHPLSQLLLERSVGESVTLTIARGEEQQKIPVVLGKKPKGL